MSKLCLIKSLFEVLIQSVMIAETISLGILALPKALATLGLVPYDIPPRR